MRLSRWVLCRLALRRTKIGSRRCCCGECWSFLDYFNRDDSTDLGDDWEELDGSWEIKSSQLYESGNPDALVVGTQAQPSYSAGNQYVEVTACNFVSGQNLVLYACAKRYIDYGTGSGTGVTLGHLASYWKAKFTKTGAGDYDDWEVKLYRNEVLVDTALITPAPHLIDAEAPILGSDINHVRCYLCADEAGNPRAGIISSGDEPAWAIELGGLSGRYYGVGHTNSIATYLNDFAVYELHDPTKACRDCWCPCCKNQLSPVLLATIVVDPGTSPNRASCFDGDDTELIWQWEGGLRHHHGTITHVREGSSYTWDLTLSCDDTADGNCTGQNINLNVVSGCARLDDPSTGSLCTGAGCTLKPLAGSTCEPLNLIYGPFYYGSTMLTCAACMSPMTDPTNVGKYYIVITEAVGVMTWEDGGLASWEDGTVRFWE